MLDFDLHICFDAVLCLFSSIAYLSSIDALGQAFANMARHTLPGGVVIVEPWIHPEAFRPGTTSAVLVDKPDLKIARLGVARTDGHLSVFDLHYLVCSSDGVRHFQERHELALWSHIEYQSALEAAGLQVVHDPVGLDKRGLYIGLKPP
jgi:hypothetical protein